MLFGFPERCAHSCLIEHCHPVSRQLCQWHVRVRSSCVSQTWCGGVCVARTRYQVPVISQQALRTTQMNLHANVLVNWCAAPLTAHVSIHCVLARDSRKIFWCRCRAEILKLSHKSIASLSFTHRHRQARTRQANLHDTWGM